MVSTAARARARGPAAAAPPQAQQHEEGGQEEGGDIEEDGMTEIERQRLANIQRNAEVLLQAGLGGGQSLLGRRKQGPGAGTAGDEARRRKKAAAPPKRPPQEPTRRSSRNLGKEAPDYREAPDIRPTPAALVGREGRYKWAPDGSDGAAADLGPGEEFDAAAIRAARAAAAAEASGPAPGSSRTMKADVEGMLAGYLGKKVPYTGKACVMELLTPEGAGYAKFSKYAGVVEWANAIVLWVNVDGGDYDNLFLKGGQEMTWFAGSRATGETSVILRLLEAGRAPEGAGGKEGKKDEILLFCRLQGEPYVCMGRVYHTWYETRRYPVKVVWRLRDWGAIKDSVDVKEVWGDAIGGEGDGEEGGKGGKKT